jgi:hypothetical protein
MPPSIPLCDDTSIASSFSVMESKPHSSNLSSSQRVEFASNHSIQIFDKAEDDVRREIWYTQEEYDIIKARNSLIVKMMKAGSFDESEDHSFRGLEHKLKDGYKQRKANKLNGLNSVLEEQDRQYAKKVKNEALLADIYRRVTQNARESAFILGLKDSEQSFVAISFISEQTFPSSGCDVLHHVEDTEELHVDSLHLSKKKTNKFKKFFGLSSSKSKTEIDRKIPTLNHDIRESLGWSSQHENFKRRATRRASM